MVTDFNDPPPYCIDPVDNESVPEIRVGRRLSTVAVDIHSFSHFFQLEPLKFHDQWLFDRLGQGDADTVLDVHVDLNLVEALLDENNGKNSCRRILSLPQKSSLLITDAVSNFFGGCHRHVVLKVLSEVVDFSVNMGYKALPHGALYLPNLGAHPQPQHSDFQGAPPNFGFNLKILRSSIEVILEEIRLIKIRDSVEGGVV